MTKNIRDIAIVVHVDHGKTTLVDQLLKQSGVFHQHQQVREGIMDSGDIEQERGIAILSRDTAICYKDTEINIIDTPGHADFGGEVGRVLRMMSGIVLLVDAYKDPMLQTGLVLKQAFDLRLPILVCTNKIDRPEARPSEVGAEILDLFIELGADDHALDLPFIYTSAKSGYASLDPRDREGSMEPLFGAILKYISEPEDRDDEPLALLISTIDYNDYMGRIGIGCTSQGTIHANGQALTVNHQDPDKKEKAKIAGIFEFRGLERVPAGVGTDGNIVAVTGIENISTGDTITGLENPQTIAFSKVSESAISMTFRVNDSPLVGQEGRLITSRQLRSRFFKELQTDVSLQVEDGDSTDSLKVSGRGKLHLSVLIESMRREGYRFSVSKPRVFFKEVDGTRFEPTELVTIDVGQEFVGGVIEKLGRQKGEMISMSEPSGGYARLTFEIPVRGLIDYRQEFMTDTRGSEILNSVFKDYKRCKGGIPARKTGSITSYDTGVSSAYGLNNAQERGSLFVGSGKKVYGRTVVGENPKGIDLEVSVTKAKKQANVRASGSDDASKLPLLVLMSLEQAIEFIEDDGMIGVAPTGLRIRKVILDTGRHYKTSRRK